MAEKFGNANRQQWHGSKAQDGIENQNKSQAHLAAAAARAVVF
jgi:hypothetical protein